jgi:hypothetical protein
MTNRSTALARGNGARWSSGERLTLQFNQRTAGIVALGLDSRELSLGVGQGCAHLGQFGPYIAEHRPQLIALGAHGCQFSTYSRQLRFHLTEGNRGGDASCGVN